MPCWKIRFALVLLLMAPAIRAQTLNDPFDARIPLTEGVITVGVAEFASLPDVDGDPARMMLLVDEPGTGRLFVNDMRGLLYSVDYDGQTVTPYLDLTAAVWGLSVQAARGEQGLQSFAFHPQFSQAGTPGFGKFYTYLDTSNSSPPPDFAPGGGDDTHDTILLEWTAEDPSAEVYSGAQPREMMRFEQPFRNHNGGQLAFNSAVSPGDADFGLLYIGSADGGSGGDPLDLAQNRGVAFGKILRIDPLGSDSANGRYGIPMDNPFVDDGNPNTLPEIYAYGVRNPQRFGWDSTTGNMFFSDIGQNLVEEVSLVTRGANLGWNDWEGSYRYIGRQEVSLVDQRGKAGLTYPVVEYGHRDPPLLSRPAAATGVVVYRDDVIPQLTNLLLFGDFPSGEVFYVQADQLPEGGQDAIRRVLFRDAGASKTLLQLIQKKNRGQGRSPASRADLRFGTGPAGQLFLLNKRDGVIRLLVP